MQVNKEGHCPLELSDRCQDLRAVMKTWSRQTEVFQKQIPIAHSDKQSVLPVLSTTQTPSEATGLCRRNAFGEELVNAKQRLNFSLAFIHLLK